MSNTNKTSNTADLAAMPLKLGFRKMYIGRAASLLLGALYFSDQVGLATANQVLNKAQNQNQLHLEALERAEGIYDRVVQKLQQKEEAKKKMVQEQVNE